MRTIIADDEPLARSNLSVLLRLDPEIEIIGECSSGADALAEIRSELVSYPPGSDSSNTFQCQL